MDIAKLDERLASKGIDAAEIEWISCHDKRFSIHGVYYNEQEKLFMRVPDEVSKATGNNNLYSLARMTAGGRLRFVTDSDFIVIKAELPCFKPAPHMSFTTTHGFSVYTDGVYRNRYSAGFENFLEVDDWEMGKIYFAEKKPITTANKSQVIDVYFPLYGGVCDFYIGVAPGSEIKPAPAYKLQKPFLFYGSSVTQGACVSRPGNDYISILARRFDADYINLGFSGNGNAEDAMIDYITSFDASLYAFDYNMYQSKADRVLPPHFEIYERIRDKHPDAVILLYDKPGCDYEGFLEREIIIQNTYEKALKLGDKRVCHIPPKAFLGESERDCCMVDVSHPNDLGAMRMADAIYTAISKWF